MAESYYTHDQLKRLQLMKVFIKKNLNKIDIEEVHKYFYDKRFLHPLALDHLTATRNDLFQFMISNTDFSSGYHHNGKVVYIDKKMMPIPYDFDMSGLVDASYATVSKIQNQALEITEVTERMYRGFKRDEQVLQQIRKQFLDNKIQAIQTIDSFSTEFENQKEFNITKKFILDFYEIMASDLKFKKQIIDRCRI